MSADRLFARSYLGLIFAKPPPPPTPPGNQTFIGGSGTPGRYQTFTVPQGINFISAVVVSYTSQWTPNNSNNGYVACRITRSSGAELLSTSSGLNAGGVGGGNGGLRGGDFQGNSSNSSPHRYYFSSGGAAGYTGNGGNGGFGSQNGSGGMGGGGAGGGGGGGAGCVGNPPYWYGEQGGGVGLFGQGNDGIRGYREPQEPGYGKGGTGSEIIGPYVGAGYGGSSGGDMRWLNNIPVVPGEVLTIDLGTNERNASQNTGAGCRIIYGDSRSFPNNVPDSVPQGQLVVTNQKTYSYVVPPNVTSICVCAQEHYANGSATAVSVTRGGTVLVRAQKGARVGDGGGDGGVSPYATWTSGGGGAGGYDGNGGDGGGTISYGSDGEWAGQGGQAGTNSGQAGGNGSSQSKSTSPVFGGSGQSSTSYNYTAATAGGGIGIKGKMANGSYSDPVHGNSGGGGPGYDGGSLSWRNNIAVTPGETLTFSCEFGRVRVIYGPGRSYPNNAMDL